mgnify:CR=1 FL=1
MYAGVVLTEASESWSVLNVRGLAIAAFAGRQALPMVYDGKRPPPASPAARPNGRRRNSD